MFSQGAAIWNTCWRSHIFFLSFLSVIVFSLPYLPQKELPLPMTSLFSKKKMQNRNLEVLPAVCHHLAILSNQQSGNSIHIQNPLFYIFFAFIVSVRSFWVLTVLSLSLQIWTFLIFFFLYALLSYFKLVFFVYWFITKFFIKLCQSHQ